MGKEFGIDVSIRNKELQTIQDIREAMQRKRLLETESEKKRVE